MRSEPDLINQKESFERRGEAAPLRHVLGTFVDRVDSTFSFVTANQAIFTFVYNSDLWRYSELIQARCCVTGAIAASNMRCALYQLQNTSKANALKLIRLPKTHVTFPTTATGRVTVTLSDPVNIPSGVTLAFGFVSTHTTQTLVGQGAVAAGAKLVNSFFQNGITGDLPAEVNLDDAAIGTANHVLPYIAYVSREWSRF